LPSYKAIYAYAWDLAEDGAADAVRQFRELGLDTVTVAGSYHAGKFHCGQIVILMALETLVAFLQAYVFAILTCIYLNDAIHPGH